LSSAVLIAIEGIDGSGKGTQAARLVAALQSSGRSAALFGFPRYTETFFGNRVGEFLNGKFGSLADADPFLVALLFAGDRFESRSRLQHLLETHDIVVLDRYVASNIAHQAAKRDGDDRTRLIDHIARLEFDIYQLPRADRVILLDLPAETARELVARKARRNYTEAEADLQEADVAYQRRVRDLYRELAASDPAWRIVSVTDASGALRQVETIASEVLSHVPGIPKASQPHAHRTSQQ
jgi:dTMP kinase